MSGAQLSGLNCRGLNCPGLNCPRLNCRGINCPGLNCPGPNCPGLNCRGLNCRGLNCRGLNCPGPNCRGLNCRGLNCRGSIVRGSLVGYNHIRDEHAKMMSGAECNLIYNSDNREQANTTGVAYDLLHNTCSGKQQYSICLIVFSRLFITLLLPTTLCDYHLLLDQHNLTHICSVRSGRKFWQEPKPEPDCYYLAGTGSTSYKAGRVWPDS